MSFWIYMLRCSDDSIYTGSTEDVARRLTEHEDRKCEYTSTRLPVRLIYSVSMPTRLDSKLGEWQLKGWSRAKKLALAAGDLRRLSELARCHSRKKQESK